MEVCAEMGSFFFFPLIYESRCGEAWVNIDRSLLEMQPLIHAGGVSSLDLCAQVWEEGKARARMRAVMLVVPLCVVLLTDATLGVVLPKPMKVDLR